MQDITTPVREMATARDDDAVPIGARARQDPALRGTRTTVPGNGSASDLLDRVRPGVIRALIMFMPPLLTWCMWSYCLSLDWGGMQFLTGIAGIALGLVSLAMAIAVTLEILENPRSLINKAMRRLTSRHGIAAAAADMIRRDWHRSTVTTSSGVGTEDAGRVVGTRSTIIVLPSGAGVRVVHRYRATPLVILDPDGERMAARNQTVEAKQAVGTAASLRIAAEVEGRQIHALAMRLGMMDAVTAETMSRTLAALAIDEPDEKTYNSLPSVEKNDWVRRIHRLPADVVVTTIGQRDSTTVHECLVTAPGIGVLSLPTYGFNAVMRKARNDRMANAFGARRSKRASMPIFIGNARATRLAELAQRGLDEDPDLIDDDGNRIRPLFEEHLPRLIDRHRSSTRTAGTERIAEIDAELDRGLDIIARALGQALDRLADRRQDDLRTEVRFLEARHPEDVLTA